MVTGHSTPPSTIGSDRWKERLTTSNYNMPPVHTIHIIHTYMYYTSFRFYLININNNYLNILHCVNSGTCIYTCELRYEFWCQLRHELMLTQVWLIYSAKIMQFLGTQSFMSWSNSDTLVTYFDSREGGNLVSRFQKEKYIRRDRHRVVSITTYLPLFFFFPQILNINKWP